MIRYSYAVSPERKKNRREKGESRRLSLTCGNSRPRLSSRAKLESYFYTINKPHTAGEFFL
jgi:hypothetical protein